MATVQGIKRRSRVDVTLSGTQGESGPDTVAEAQKETPHVPQDSILLNALLWRRQSCNGWGS